MAHFAVLSPSYAGHLLASLPICLQLQGQGHRVTFISDERAKPLVDRHGVAFRPLPEGRRSGASFLPFLVLASLVGQAGYAYLRDAIRKTAMAWLDNATPLVESLDVDALIVEQFLASGGTIAEHLGIPFGTLSSALDLREQAESPPVFTDWRYIHGTLGRVRNRAGYQLWRFFMAPTLRAINRWRRARGMSALSHPDQFLSSRAQIIQGCAGFDFPRRLLPWVHYGGCLACGGVPTEAEFPWEKLDGRPIVYASLGTVASRRNRQVLERIAAACAEMPVQLVLSRGRWSDQQGRSGEDLKLLGEPLVVDYVPQVQLLDRTSVMVNHGGINSVMEALSAGVPQVVCPRENDQMGTAARAVRAGVALAHGFGDKSERKLRQTIERVLTDESFRDRASMLKDELAATGGAKESAMFIERSLLR